MLDIGYEKTPAEEVAVRLTYSAVLIIGVISTIVRYFFSDKRPRWKVLVLDAIVVIILTLLALLLLRQDVFPNRVAELFHHPLWFRTGVFIVFVREFSAYRLNLQKMAINPAMIFVLSFIFLIILGAFLLMLPLATHDGITFFEAMFTATSAVCVTGLMILDMQVELTPLGITIVLFLVQIGGIGIMTFASYFSYFFTGGSSYKSHMMLSDMNQSQKLGEAFTLLKVILITTLLIEGLGMGLIFTTIDKNWMPAFGDRLFFALFHSVSAFCNAGISTLPGNVFASTQQFNYGLLMVISIMVILGGLGFPILQGLVRLARFTIRNKIRLLIYRQPPDKLPMWMSVNTRIVLVTTGILLGVGMVSIFALEYQNALAPHSLPGKLVMSFFGSAIPRTAGFNSIDIGILHFPTVMLIMLLMWVGASPGSTGGGIKTSSIALATLNFIGLAKGRSRLEIAKREISEMSVRRAFAMISLSLMVIGVGVFFISLFDSQQDLLRIAFECFAAYSTAGMSYGLAQELSFPGQVVIMLLMFCGRIGMLTLLAAMFRRVKNKLYTYPKEDILIQ